MLTRVKTLAAFVKEAGLPADSGALEAGALTVEQIVRAKQRFDLSLNFEKIDVDERNSGWTSPGIEYSPTNQHRHNSIRLATKSTLHTVRLTLVGSSQYSSDIM